ncbi:MAG: methyltransferase domain-containing protein [Phycisphaerales bacterium]
MPSKSPARREQPKEYVLGTDQTESDRLGLQHRLWSACAHDLWEQARIGPGQLMLDVGCGPGHATIDMAEIAGPTGRVIAIDESPLFLKQLNDRVQGRHLSNVDRVLGDAAKLGEMLPYIQGAADLAYARWVLCFVPDPEAVVAGVAALLKAGGRFAVQDYFNYESMSLAPRREAFSRVIRAVAASWRGRGGDPDIMSRLPGLFRKHGLEVAHLAVRQRIATPGSTMWNWPDSFWRSFVPRLQEQRQITAEERAAFERAWAEASADPDTFMQLPPVFDLVGVKR